MTPFDYINPDKPEGQFLRQHVNPLWLQGHFEKHGRKSVLHRTDGFTITRPGLRPVRSLFVMPKFDVSVMNHHDDLIRRRNLRLACQPGRIWETHDYGHHQSLYFKFTSFGMVLFMTISGCFGHRPKLHRGYLLRSYLRDSGALATLLTLHVTCPLGKVHLLPGMQRLPLSVSPLSRKGV